MYQYSETDQQALQARINEFEGQIQQYHSGELTDEEFRPLRLINGLYLQRHAHMLRVAIPYGLLSTQQLRMLAQVADKYDRGYGHFSTRQNIQYNWVELAEIPSLLRDLASVNMHSIQTSGNCVRNITSDAYAGVVADEIADPRPYCELIRQWGTMHPLFTKLPRKFKIAVTGAVNDRAATQVHDVGLRLQKNAAGEIGFTLLVGGGLGRTPVIGQVLYEFVPEQELLARLEAVLTVYNRLGRRDNKYKARIKILVKDLGLDEFKRLAAAEFVKLDINSYPRVNPQGLDQLKSFFTPLNYQADAPPLEIDSIANPAFKRWLNTCTYAHKVSGYRVVTVSVKNTGEAPGDMDSRQMRAVADLADTYSFGLVRVTHMQNLVLADVREVDLFAVWQALQEIGLAHPVIGLLTDIICCPGLDYCSLANASSISLTKQIQDKFDDWDYLYDLGELRLNISGCVNACAHHHVGHIGILGVDKKGEQFYQIMLGGSSGNDAQLATKLGAALPPDAVVGALERILEVYLQQRQAHERFFDTCQRIGLEPFKAACYVV